MNVVNTERDGFICRSCVGEPIEKILEVLGNERISTIQLTQKTDLEKYAVIFESLADASQITELILSNGGINETDYLERIFSRVGHLETLSCYYNRQILKAMEGLENLKKVTIYNVEYGKEIENFFDSQANIMNLKLTMESRNDGIEMLTYLSGNNSLRNNLAELDLDMDFGSDALEKIKTFKNLKVLKVKASFGKGLSIDFSGLPKHLEHIKMCGLKIPCSQFFLILDSLESLMVFDVGKGDIFLDEDKGLGDSQVTTFIARKLIENHPQRTVNIMRIKSCTRF